MSEWGVAEWIAFLTVGAPVVAVSLAITIRVVIEILRGD